MIDPNAVEPDMNVLTDKKLVELSDLAHHISDYMAPRWYSSYDMYQLILKFYNENGRYYNK